MIQAFTRKITLLILILFIGLCSYAQNEKSNFKETKTKKSISNIDVIITQYKALIESPEIPYCKAVIEILKNEIKIDSIDFEAIEPVGGDYGLLVYNEQIKKHIIISKFGDYDGESIIINEKGEVFKTIGGRIFADTENGLLFSIYDSDISGFSVFDLNNDKTIFEMTDIEDRPYEFYKFSNNRYIYKANNDESNSESIWEIEFDMDRIMQLDLTDEDLKGKKLNEMIDYKEININCE